MTGLTLAVLLSGAAFLVWGRWPAPVREVLEGKPLHGSAVRLQRARTADPDPDAPALLVRELAGLLSAGRSAQRVWADAASLYTAKNPAGGRIHPFLPVLQAAGAAAALGLSPVAVFADAAVRDSGRRGAGPWRAGRKAGTADRPPVGGRLDGAGQVGLLWAGLATCVRVSERSGAPLAAVLMRYAGQLDDSRDAAADRAAALAGPRATVRLLTWLPAGGMGLGYLLGGNPLQILAGTPLGWVAAGSGCGLWLAGYLWSGWIVRRAADPAEPADQR
ncbi:hypothetical protein [Arthrobacter sp. zg-Y1143]|uniref:hypothetical protein n=1 Tax=Arthrobacter sp. zg-Y1143 TaxID=3049065 RepID=UPI0024C2C476|nr:hypothetical protein [Arthrobacter sp. zg-Y1143]MDK1326756.1 hypothetical protein [Arthrobacter sp. zg-Y1143]